MHVSLRHIFTKDTIVWICHWWIVFSSFFIFFEFLSYKVMIIMLMETTNLNVFMDIIVSVAETPFHRANLIINRDCNFTLFNWRNANKWWYPLDMQIINISLTIKYYISNVNLAHTHKNTTFEVETKWQIVYNAILQLTKQM